MKKYVKNKKFLPLTYIKGMNLEIEKRERKDCIILLVMCLVLLPHTLSIVANKNDNSRKNETNEYRKEDTYKHESSKNESLNNSMEYINKIIEGNFDNGKGEIYIKGKEKLADYINNKKITVNNIESLDEEEFKLEIEEN